MNLEADTVTEPVTEELTKSSLLDDLAGSLVRSSPFYAGLDGIQSFSFGTTNRPIDCAQFS